MKHIKVKLNLTLPCASQIGGFTFVNPIPFLRIGVMSVIPISQVEDLFGHIPLYLRVITLFFHEIGDI